ncbi:hypothetical protein DEU56DRAFT_910688 [Suillus clintonianus]|uniref:uncharacterized protein n=1 Tax=Suillus clintonianus TaxID=1904413 RepID=UPI001B8643E3|nr:uncharacterized protein DEU56DRAFT_910688 [Suillus clintonianus]KAG2144334.1 hypothetical protein DEU56DRAFT_910688 [Suillus clintonianus]
MSSFQCPSCGKGGFKNDVTVAHHMSQPCSGCSTWLQDLICLRSESDSRMDSDDEPNISMDMDDASEPNMPDIESGGLGDWDEMSRGSTSGSESQEMPTHNSEVIDSYPDCAQSYGKGYTFLNLFNSDNNSKHRATNPYYPFSGRKDWEVGSWLLRSGLSMGKIDNFLSLEMTLFNPRVLSALRIIILVRSSEPWDYIPKAKYLRLYLRVVYTLLVSTRTKSRVVFPLSGTYSGKERSARAEAKPLRSDPLNTVLTLNHPAFHDQLDFTPHRVYTTAQRLCHVYSEWMTGDDAWNMQSALPRGATLLGTILSSDKTNILTMTGDRVAHPLLISLANIRMSTRLKSSSNAFVLTALLPVPKFIYKKKHMRGVLEDRLIHECLDIVLRPLKVAAREGVMLSDPVGHSRYCFTPLTSYIVDTPEAMMLAAVGGKTSPVTMAMYKQFGDPFRHEPRTRATTLSQLASARSKVDPDDIEAFFCEAQKFRLNGVNTPFWLDWLLSDPSHFLTPEFLHLIHRKFYDHDAKWLICAVGDTEIDFRFSVLQAITGFRHFHGRISKLKQVAGRAQHNIQRSIVAVSADASPVIDDTQLARISTAPEEFHANKDAIIDGGFRRGQCGGVIENWYIPKLELMQSIVPSIRNTGVPLQWTADTTEHAHITEIKDPACSSNNKNYDPQICRHLDRTDKCRHFDLAMSLLNNMTDSKWQGSDDVGDVNNNVDLEEPCAI